MTKSQEWIQGYAQDILKKATVKAATKPVLEKKYPDRSRTPIKTAAKTDLNKTASKPDLNKTTSRPDLNKNTSKLELNKTTSRIENNRTPRKEPAKVASKIEGNKTPRKDGTRTPTRIESNRTPRKEANKPKPEENRAVKKAIYSKYLDQSKLK